MIRPLRTGSTRAVAGILLLHALAACSTIGPAEIAGTSPANTRVDEAIAENERAEGGVDGSEWGRMCAVHACREPVNRSWVFQKCLST